MEHQILMVVREFRGALTPDQLEADPFWMARAAELLEAEGSAQARYLQGKAKVAQSSPATRHRLT
jgi:hypothetical protein